MLKRAHEHVHTDDAPVAKQLKGILKLNVGGKAFTSTASTLEGSPFFAVLLSGRFEEPRDQDGAVFVDRDGTHFDVVLNHLRGCLSRCVTDYLEPIPRCLCVNEAEFYQLPELVERLVVPGVGVQVCFKFGVFQRTGALSNGGQEEYHAECNGIAASYGSGTWVLSITEPLRADQVRDPQGGWPQIGEDLPIDLHFSQERAGTFSTSDLRLRKDAQWPKPLNDWINQRRSQGSSVFSSLRREVRVSWLQENGQWAELWAVRCGAPGCI